MSNSKLLLFIASIVQITSHVHGTHLPDSDFSKSSCSTTLYPEICYSTLSTTKNLATQKDVIELSINKTKETIRGNFNTIKKLTATANLSKRCKIALYNCLEMTAGTLEGLDMVIRKLKVYPTRKSLRKHADDLKTLMSTTITNKETCLDDLSYDADCKRLRESIIQGQDLGGKMCSNVLAMIKNMTDTDMAKKEDVRKLNEEKWPEWFSTRDRKLLFGFWGVTPNVIVAKDGKGNYTTVAQAVQAAPSQSNSRYVIKIAAGVYKENVEVPRSKTNLMFIGDGKDKTTITGNKNVANGGSTTSTSATVVVIGNGFLARDITFENSAGAAGHQAVALRVASDLSAFYKCAMMGYQDTLYVQSSRQFYTNCLVVGTVDFIFGDAAVVFQNCDIQARRPNPHQKNMVTAQGREDPNENTGIVIQSCNIGATADLKEVQANFSTYLGRPWKKHSRTVIMKSKISDVISPEGWAPWDGNFALDTLYYREFRNSGPGADTSKRVKWKGWGVMMFSFEVVPFTVGNFIGGWSWLPSTGFPYWLGW